MRIDKRAEIELLVSKEKNRKILQYVKVGTIGESSTVYASACDGRALACVPVELDAGEPAPASVLLSPDKCKRVRKCIHHVKLNGKLEFPLGDTSPVETEETVGKYPNLSAAIPPPDRPVKFQVAIDAELLAKIQRAMGSEHVLLQFEDDVSPIVVKPSGKQVHGAFGVLMPVRAS